jgi:chaperonin GroEL (HSP60 family)
MNPIQIARGIEKTAIALVSELRSMSREVSYILSSIFFPIDFCYKKLLVEYMDDFKS